MQPDLSMLPGRGSLVVACAECKSPFRIFPSFLTYRPEPTCGYPCKTARKRRLAHEKNSRPCVVCGLMFYRAPSSFEKEGRKTCGLKCRAIWQTGRLMAKPDSLIRRFADKRVRHAGCWGWIGSTGNGYGIIGGPNQRNLYAHRLAWEEATGDTLTSEDTICHTCDNPPCTKNDDKGWYIVSGIVLPRRGHLFKGTDAINARDAALKGRHARPTAP